VHPEVVRFLTKQRFDILDVRQSDLIGTDDRTLLQHAYAEQRTVVTHDRDFGKLVVASGEAFYGILYLRPGHLDPTFTIATLRSVLGTNLAPEPPFVLVAERQDTRVKIRLRHLG
jgi:predicted nuclease of predicted toxin-antitoxin system